MLREVISKHIRPHLTPFQATLSSGSGAVLNIGYGDITATRTGTGLVTVVPKTPYSRNGFLFAQQAQATGGSSEFVSTAGSGSSLNLKFVDNSGTVNDSVVDGLWYGFQSSDVALAKAQRVTCSLNYPVILWGRVTGTTGAVPINPGDFSCTRTATGTYSIGFRKIFGQTPVVICTGIATGSANVAQVTSKTAAGCTVVMGDTSGAAVDGDFYIVAVGQVTRSDAGKARTPIQSAQRKPRIVAFEVTNTGGTWSITTGAATGGADVGTLVDVGTGEFSVLLTEVFQREPAIITCTSLARAQIHSYASGVIRVQTRNAGGNLADVTGITHVLAIGSDDVSTY